MPETNVVNSFHTQQKRRGLNVQIAAIHALFMREILTRFGHYRLGYLWAILEPASHIGFMAILFGSFLNKTMMGIDYTVFLISGVTAWFLFASSASRALGAIDGNRGLFHYRVIKPVDTIIARVFLELIIYFTTFIVFLGIMALLGKTISTSHIPLLIISWLILALLSIGFSLILMVVSASASDIEKILAAAMRILYFLSGVIYSVHIVPIQYQKYILWNPVVHAIEFIRYAVAPTYPIHHISMSYLVVCTMLLLTLGLLIYKAREKKMLTTS